ncbi:thiamine biosynthesis protein ApbE [Gordoniibacillus kamchatkensis]|uniref:FAD:protein FMN transferase n=1 Tax=Gordoniibacillus kamchatkensis TaxID=1590651 RepID=A0ABR5AD72_9BACL|nr:FAD:protein FMN transferase [Paenibacillus sp. VKM B-2647]KIL38957.1 thiamine biosynthesis protein ApbE [Paenibacillus sp. VKM B-2647]
MKKAKLFMDTVVDIQVVASGKSADRAEAQIDRAFAAFRQVEQACSRFSPDSELMMACRQFGTPVPVSPFLFEPLKFALEVAKWTDGVFDPTVGGLMEEHGFNRHYLTGQTILSPSAESVTYRDVIVNERDRTVLLRKPLVIDLGAVAKGFAIDLAASELREFDGFVVNAGGDLFAGGVDESGSDWEIGIRHPYHKDQIVQSVTVSNEAVCTSGSYERKSAKVPGTHHLLHPKTRRSPNVWISCSIIAPFAMMADAMATAAFLLVENRGKTFIEQTGTKGILITPALQIVTVGGI